MNRAQRRAARIKAPGPQGGWLYPTLLKIVERDAKGRPTVCRVLHDDETIGDVMNPKDRNECLLVYMGEGQGSLS